MSRIDAIDHTAAFARARSSRRLVALLVVPLACAALSACGSSNKSSSKPSTPTTTAAAAAAPPATTPTAPAPTASTPAGETEQGTAFKSRRAALVAAVHCMRQHGYHLPEPDSKNNVNLHGLPVSNQHYKAVAISCLQGVKLLK